MIQLGQMFITEQWSSLSFGVAISLHQTERSCSSPVTPIAVASEFMAASKALRESASLEVELLAALDPVRLLSTASMLSLAVS